MRFLLGQDPRDRHPVRRLDAGDAIEFAVHVRRRDRQQMVGHDLGLGHDGARQADRVLRRAQRQVVAHRDRRQQHAHLLRQALAHALDALGQRLGLGAVDHAHQLVAHCHRHRLHHRQRLPVEFGHAVVAQGSLDLCHARHVRRADALCHRPADPGQHAGSHREEPPRHARHDRQDHHHAGGRVQHARPGQQLLADLVFEVARLANARDQDGGGGRQQQRRDLAHQAVADREQRVHAERIGQRQVVHQRADGDAADQVDDQDQDRGDGVAAHEFGGAVHRAIEVGFGRDVLAPRGRLLLVDQAGVEVGVDRHLLARQRVEREARRDFRDALGALGHDDEVDDHQDHEHHQADDEIAADDDVTERFDDLAGRVRAFVAVEQDDAGRGHVQRQAHQGRAQDHGREYREVERALGRHGHQDHDQRQHDVEGEQHVEQDRRQRQDDHPQERDQEHGRGELVAAQLSHEGVEGIRHGHA